MFPILLQYGIYGTTHVLAQLSVVMIMLNKNSLAVKKVRGQSEATMAISDQNL